TPRTTDTSTPGSVASARTPATTSSVRRSQLAGRPSGAATTKLGAQTRFAACHVRNLLPDPGCTPGAVFTGATVGRVCTPGYSHSVRNVPESLKRRVYAEYGIERHAPGSYEVDHLVSLELGGNNSIANLWPEVAPGYHEKDAI